MNRCAKNDGVVEISAKKTERGKHPPARRGLMGEVKVTDLTSDDLYHQSEIYKNVSTRQLASF